MTRGVQTPQNVIRFAEFELDVSRKTLSRRGIRLKLQNQPLQVLVLLIQRAPEVVSRDEIRRHVWGEYVYIDVERSINFSIRQIRGVLVDNHADARFIQTLPREGYRFVAPIDNFIEHEIEHQTSDANRPVTGKHDVADAAVKTASRRWPFVSVALTALALVAATLWLTKREAVVSVSGIVPVTSYPGDEREPSMSPDGRQVAFSWDGEDSHRHIYVKLLGEQHPLRLTRDAAEDGYPAWSPDGKQIAFIRRRVGSESDALIMLMPSIGGPERTLHRIQLGYFVAWSGRMMAWSPDGKWLCFTNELAPSTHHALFLLSLESGNVRPLFADSSAGIADSSPAFSPDGHWLALARFSGPANSKLLLQRLTANLAPAGEPLLVSNTLGNANTPVWLTDSSILFLDSNGYRIMQARIGHPARLVYAASESLDGLTLDRSGSWLVASRQIDDSDIWSLPLTGLTAAGRAERIVHSTARESQPQFSPDGRSLVFESNRSGADEIWLADANGENPRQLTHIAAYIVGFPHWSPDSQSVVFHARLPEEPQIYTIRAQDGVMRPVTHESPGFLSPSFSVDGKTIYMLQLLNGITRLHRVSVIGGSPQLLWLGCDPRESPDRNLLLYAKVDQRGIYARSLSGNTANWSEARLVEDYVPLEQSFDPVHDGIYYAGSTPSGLPRAFRFYSFASGQSVDIAPTPPNFSGDLAVTPDRTHLAYTTEAKAGQDLVQLNLRSGIQ